MTLPEQALEETLARPGDLVEVVVTGSNKIEPTIHMAPPLEDELNATLETADAIPPLTLKEALTRFRVDGPIDVEAERRAWQEEAAKDVFGERPDRWHR